MKIIKTLRSSKNKGFTFCARPTVVTTIKLIERFINSKQFTLMNKMEEQIKKVNSLLKFYYSEGIKITLKVKALNYLIVRGKILKRSFLGPRYIILKNEEKSAIKIFIEDIDPLSIMPTDYEKNKDNKSNRSPIPKHIRYKILKRDKHVCQACGASSPDVELEVDHRIPISKGGTDDESNLVTLCKDCNRGKGNKV